MRVSNLSGLLYRAVDQSPNRLSVHVYANSSGEAIEEAFNTYLKAKIRAVDNKIPVAPVEENNKKLL